MEQSPCFASLQDGSAQKDILQHSQWHSSGKGSESGLEQANRAAKPAPSKTTVWSQTGGMATGSRSRKHGKKSQPVPALFCPLSLPKACTRAPTSGSKQGLVQRGLEVLLPVRQAVSLGLPLAIRTFLVLSLCLQPGCGRVPLGGGTWGTSALCPSPALAPRAAGG